MPRITIRATSRWRRRRSNEPRFINWCALAFAALTALGGACAPLKGDALPAGARGERLFYELEVTAPGTRSQGVRGHLYDRQGQSIVVSGAGAIVPNAETQSAAQTPPSSGGSIRTDAGTFVTRSLVNLWDVSGMINEAMLPVQGLNDPSVRGPTLFRLYVHAECTRSEGWRGELFSARGGASIAPQAQPIRTPMGRFVYRTSPNLFGQNGWFPETWPSAQLGPGNWPCRAR